MQCIEACTHKGGANPVRIGEIPTPLEHASRFRDCTACAVAVAVAVPVAYLTVTSLANSKFISFICAMKIAATASYNAVPVTQQNKVAG